MASKAASDEMTRSAAMSRVASEEWPSHVRSTTMLRTRSA
jgi:hypothetical protein